MQVMRIINASFTNNQIRWIIGDPDVKLFLDEIFSKHSDVIDDQSKGEYKSIMDDLAESSS